MNPWMEKEVSTVVGIEELGYPDCVIDALVCLLGSLDGVVEKDRLPKIVRVNSLGKFIKDVEAAIRIAEDKLQWQIRILPDGAPEDCEIVMYTNDARDFLKDLFESMCARDRCIQVAVGFSPITFAAHKAGQELIKDRCVIYVFNDRAAKLADMIQIKSYYDNYSLPFNDVCHTKGALEALNKYVVKTGAAYCDENERVFDELIKLVSSEPSWAGKIKASDMRRLLNDGELAKRFVHACRTIYHHLYPVYVDRTKTTIDEAVEALARTYTEGGVANPNIGASNIISNYYLLPSVDVCAVFDNDYDEYDDIVAFVPTIIIDVSDPNFIDNVIGLTDIASVLNNNEVEARDKLEGEILITFKSLKDRIAEFVGNSGGEDADEEEDD